MAHHIIYIMGVSGSGKSTIGEMLSEKTGIPFFDGDDFHPSGNIKKMAAGQPLNDLDRQGWLEALHFLAKKERHKKGAIIACSALKKSYRTVLKNGFSNDCLFIYLNGSFETIQKRLEQRGGHFMPPVLLQSQFDTLEPPDDAIVIDINNKPEDIVTIILKIIAP